VSCEDRSKVSQLESEVSANATPAAPESDKTKPKLGFLFNCAKRRSFIIYETNFIIFCKKNITLYKLFYYNVIMYLDGVETRPVFILPDY